MASTCTCTARVTHKFAICHYGSLTKYFELQRPRYWVCRSHESSLMGGCSCKLFEYTGYGNEPQKAACLCRLEVAAYSQRAQQQHLQPQGPPGAHPDAQAGDCQGSCLVAPAQLQSLPALLHRASGWVSRPRFGGLRWVVLQMLFLNFSMPFNTIMAPACIHQ